MKKLILFTTAALSLSTLSAHASSGQQFREDARAVAKAHGLRIQREIVAAICSEEQPQFLLTTPQGRLLTLEMSALSNSKGDDSGSDTAVLKDVSSCNGKTVRF